TVRSLFTVSAEGGEAKQLTHDRFMVLAPRWSPDGTEILYVAAMNPDVPNVFFPALRVLDVASGKIRDILDDWGYATAASWTPDGKQIVFEGQPHGQILGSKTDLWVVSSKGGKPKCRTSKFKFGVGGSLQADMPLLTNAAYIPVSEDGSVAYVQ